MLLNYVLYDHAFYFIPHKDAIDWPCIIWSNEYLIEEYNMPFCIISVYLQNVLLEIVGNYVAYNQLIDKIINELIIPIPSLKSRSSQLRLEMLSLHCLNLCEQ